MLEKSIREKFSNKIKANSIEFYSPDGIRLAKKTCFNQLMSAVPFVDMKVQISSSFSKNFSIMT